MSAWSVVFPSTRLTSPIRRLMLSAFSVCSSAPLAGFLDGSSLRRRLNRPLSSSVSVRRTHIGTVSDAENPSFARLLNRPERKRLHSPHVSNISWSSLFGGCVRESKVPVPIIEPVLLVLLDRRGCAGELLMVGLTRPQNFWVYLVFN